MKLAPLRWYMFKILCTLIYRQQQREPTKLHTGNEPFHHLSFRLCAAEFYSSRTFLHVFSLTNAKEKNVPTTPETAASVCHVEAIFWPMLPNCWIFPTWIKVWLLLRSADRSAHKPNQSKMNHLLLNGEKKAQRKKPGQKQEWMDGTTSTEAPRCGEEICSSRTCFPFSAKSGVFSKK